MPRERCDLCEMPLATDNDNDRDSGNDRGSNNDRDFDVALDAQLCWRPFSGHCPKPPVDHKVEVERLRVVLDGKEEELRRAYADIDFLRASTNEYAKDWSAEFSDLGRKQKDTQAVLDILSTVHETVMKTLGWVGGETDVQCAQRVVAELAALKAGSK